MAAQVVERGVDDYADEDVLGPDGGAYDRSRPSQPFGGGGGFAPPGRAGFDFDGFAGGSGGAQGTRRALRPGPPDHWILATPHPTAAVTPRLATAGEAA